MRWTFWFVSGLMLALNASVAMAQDAEARLVLSRYRESLKGFADISYSGTIDATYAAAAQKMQQVYTFRFGRRGEVFSFDSTSIQRENDKLLESRGVYQHVVSYEGVHGKWFHKALKDPLSEVDASDEPTLRRTQEFTFVGPLEGCLYGLGDRGLVDLLEQSPSKIVEPAETVDGVTTECIEATTAYGVIRAWFAPAQGYGLVRLDHVLGADDLYNDRPLKEWRKSTMVHERLDRVTFEEINGVFVPKAGRFVIETDPNGRPETTTFLFTREKIVIAPDPIVLPAWPAVPDGTQVAVWRVVDGAVRIAQDEGHYVMKDGKVTVDHSINDPRGPDPAVLREMERQEAIARTPVKTTRDAGSLEWALYASVLVLGAIVIGGWLLTRKDREN